MVMPNNLSGAGAGRRHPSERKAGKQPAGSFSQWALQTHLAWSPIYLIENFGTTPHPHHGKHTLSTTPHLPDGNTHLVPHPIYLMEHTLVPTPSPPHRKHTLDTTPHLPDGNTHLVPHPIYLMGTYTWHPTPAYDDVCYPKFGYKGFSSSDGIIQTPTNWNL